MIKTAIGTVVSIEYIDNDIVKFKALIGSEEFKCINYNGLTGKIEIGDSVLLNTTAVELMLGSGGYHFVIANLSKSDIDNIGIGHIMKLKYTPFQINCMTAEAQESPHHDVFNSFASLAGMPVIAGSLHSMLAPCSVYIKSKSPETNICYIMTDGGALPIYVSDTVRKLKEVGIIGSTITYGNAFGGDLECINIYTALIAAKEIAKADIAIVCMGQGIVGTETKYGFSGTEQGVIIDAANKLGGLGILIPRISFSDSRERHLGLSHHTVTVLKDICCTIANIAVPKFKDMNKISKLEEQIHKNNLRSLHNIIYVDYEDIQDILYKNKAYLNKMGKGLQDDMEYFVTCASAGKLAIDRLN